MTHKIVRWLDEEGKGRVTVSGISEVEAELIRKGQYTRLSEEETKRAIRTRLNGMVMVKGSHRARRHLRKPPRQGFY